MTLSNPKKYYTHFLKGHEGKLHFAAHSHHFWPDVSREGHMQYWDDCAVMSDHKWEKIFQQIVPITQKHIARLLNLKDHSQIALAPNTHELASRLLSLFLGKARLKILTTSSEFHSWDRQITRLMELPQVQVTKVSTKMFLHDRRSMIEELKTKLSDAPDVFFISQVFFDSGLALTDNELFELQASAPDETLMVIDGYHGFAALPTDLSKLEGRVFYLGGGYKYAQGGEGIGFMVVPKGNWRPAYTGWFAEYSELSSAKGSLVGYAPDGMAFLGATQDTSGLYRFNSVWDQFFNDSLTIDQIHSYVKKLQQEFLRLLPQDFCERWKLLPLFENKLDWHGHFLTFEAPGLSEAQDLYDRLYQNKILIDKRANRLRFGFGLYQDKEDVEKLSQCLKKLANFSQ